MVFLNDSLSGVESFLKVLGGAATSPIRRTVTIKPAEFQRVLCLISLKNKEPIVVSILYQDNRQFDIFKSFQLGLYCVLMIG